MDRRHLLVGVSVGLVGLSVFGCGNNKKQEEGRAQLTQRVAQQLEAAQAKADAYEFDAAKAILRDLPEQVDKCPFADVATYDKLTADIEAVRRTVSDQESEYRRKMRAGWKLIAGKLVSPEDQARALAQRKRQEEAERTRREAEKARVAAEAKARDEAVGEQRRREEAESARRAAEDARLAAKAKARQHAIGESIESPVTLKVRNGELRVRFQFTTLYIPTSPCETRLGYGGFFFVTYQESGATIQKKPVEGYFRVNGKAQKLSVRSSNEKVLAGMRIPTRRSRQEILQGEPPTKVTLSRDLNYTDDRGLHLTAVGPGVATITVTLAGRSVSIPMKVVQPPINGGGLHAATRRGKAAHTKEGVIKILGLPDERVERYLSWPESAWVDGIYYSASDPRYGVHIEHWKYKDYPGAVITFDGNHVDDVRSVQRFEVP